MCPADVVGPCSILDEVQVIDQARQPAGGGIDWRIRPRCRAPEGRGHRSWAGRRGSRSGQVSTNAASRSPMLPRRTMNSCCHACSLIRVPMSLSTFVEVVEERLLVGRSSSRIAFFSLRIRHRARPPGCRPVWSRNAGSPRRATACNPLRAVGAQVVGHLAGSHREAAKHRVTKVERLSACLRSAVNVS